MARAKCWRLQNTVWAEKIQNGQFSVRGIAPGDYKLFAWEAIEEGAYQDPEFLRPYEERGKPIHVDEGSRLNSQLQLILANEPTP